ncbi:hopanoid-associated phosphorylase [Nitrosomonas eutropha]|uniref:phosphorylase family protein n=1 Tax=Nitrosomonas eutropha TaxID=916 RepID=UPI0008904DEC|nr:purine phosphorylase [Nitrosomonas eutropha]SCX00602.1 hopanoid-associated phosphorylase [Nitrosomonas eutropha]
MNSRVGIIVALRAEARCITQRRLTFDRAVALDENLTIRICGMGGAAARRAAADLCNQAGVAGLISFGVAGALDDGLQPGHLVLPESVLADKNYPTDGMWRTSVQHCLPDHINVTCDPLATSDEVLTTEAAKRMFALQSGGCAVDMESGAIAAVAAEKGISFLVIRAISDPVQFSPPAALMDALQPDGSVKPIPLLTLLLKRSLNLNELLHLVPGMQAACRTLKQVAQSARHELGRQGQATSNKQRFN